MFSKFHRVVRMSLLLLTISFAFFLPSFGSDLTTTVILVRHAEKNTSIAEDPPLTAAGRERAQELVRMFENTGIQMLLTTPYARTRQTITPLAQKLNLTPLEVKETDLIVSQIRKEQAGKVTLLVGHSDTIPELIRKLGGISIPEIPDTQYDDLFILTLPASGKPTVLRMKYGSPSH
jgi:broad specificity phosphatase PhoE